LAELDGLDLVLDFKTLADIYLGEITMWNDSRILALNSEATVAALPARPIQVIVQTTSSAITESFTTLLNATVPAFAEQVFY
jgi:phosphate transport system substrate-binding protein